MLILFDNGTPAPLRSALGDHIVVECFERDWDRLTNGALLAEAEAAGFDVLVTTDKNMLYQQNLTNRRLSFVVLGNSRWPVLQKYVARVRAAVEASTPGSYTVVDVPLA
jgi:hypothetical protein